MGVAHKLQVRRGTVQYWGRVCWCSPLCAGGKGTACPSSQYGRPTAHGVEVREEPAHLCTEQRGGKTLFCACITCHPEHPWHLLVHPQQCEAHAAYDPWLLRCWTSLPLLTESLFNYRSVVLISSTDLLDL